MRLPGLALLLLWLAASARAEDFSPLKPVLLPTGIATGAAAAVYGLSAKDAAVAPPIIGVVAAVLALGYTVDIDRGSGYPAILLHGGGGAEDRAEVYTLNQHAREVRTTLIVGGVNLVADGVLLATAPNAGSRVAAALALATPLAAGALVWEKFFPPEKTQARFQSGPSLFAIGGGFLPGWGVSVSR